MKKLLFIILILFNLSSFGQSTTQILTGPTTKALVKGGIQIDSAAAIPKDTIMRANWPKSLPHIADKNGDLFLWNVAGQYWKRAGSNDTAYRRNDSLFYKKNGTELSLGTYLTKNTADLVYASLSGNNNYLQNQYSSLQDANAYFKRLRLSGKLTLDSVHQWATFTTNPTGQNNATVWYNETLNKFYGVGAGTTRAFVQEGDTTGTSNWIFNNGTNQQTANFYINGMGRMGRIVAGGASDPGGSYAGAIQGTLRFMSASIIEAPNTSLTIRATSSSGQIQIKGSTTGSGVSISKTDSEGHPLRLSDEGAGASNTEWMTFGYKRTLNVGSAGTDQFLNLVGFYQSVNLYHNSSSYSKVASAKSGYIDFYPLGTDGNLVKWTRVISSTGLIGITQWKTYYNKTELYPDGGTATFVNGAPTIKYPNLPTYADDAAAGAGGLTAGTLYKTSTGVLMVKL